MQNVLITNQKKKRKGFTLIELIIVLAVMAIIAAIAIPNFSAVSKNSKNKADVQSAETIKRNVLMLVSDDSISKPSTAATPNIYNVNFDANDKISSVTKTNGSDADLPVIKEALQEVKAPQGKVKSGSTYTDTDAEIYKITISNTGSVTVEPTKDTTP